MVLLLEDDRVSGGFSAPSPRPAVLAGPGLRASPPVRAPEDYGASATAPLVRVALVVDDDELAAMVIAEHCRSIGIDVSEAYHPREALDLLTRRGDIEAIISDVRMPGMNGPELVRRAIELHPNMAVVYVTGYAVEDIDGALAPWPVLRKPFDLAELGPALRRASGLR